MPVCDRSGLSERALENLGFKLLGPGHGLANAIISIGIFKVPVFARITRAAANGVWAREFVLAARACARVVSVLSLNRMGDGLRDLLDPRRARTR